MLIPPKKIGRPTVRPDGAVLADLYAVHTAQQIADMYGVTKGTVRVWIADERRKDREKNGE